MKYIFSVKLSFVINKKYFDLDENVIMILLHIYSFILVFHLHFFYALKFNYPICVNFYDCNAKK